MRMKYDGDADAAFIYFVEQVPPGGVARSEMCDLEVSEGAVILLLDEDDRVLGIEVLGASRLLPPQVLESGTDAPEEG